MLRHRFNDPSPFEAILCSVIAFRVCTAALLAAVLVSADEIPAISAKSLEGHLSFLASDLLEGRDTPSRGLDIAAEYIAAQFRRIGLKPVGDDGYFQTNTLEGGTKVRNVIGVLPGSDPKLKHTYVFVTAHYDHLGMRPEGEGYIDRIYNGANDDGSGVVSAIEVAASLASMKTRPKRSIVFMT